MRRKRTLTAFGRLLCIEADPVFACFGSSPVRRAVPPVRHPGYPAARCGGRDLAAGSPWPPGSPGFNTVRQQHTVNAAAAPGRCAFDGILRSLPWPVNLRPARAFRSWLAAWRYRPPPQSGSQAHRSAFNQFNSIQAAINCINNYKLIIIVTLTRHRAARCCASS